MTDQELVQYYTNLLIIQYRSKTKAPAHIAALLDKLIIFELMRKVENGYDVDTATGEEQDILGKYIGVNRTITGTTFSRDYFGYVLYADTPPVAGIEGYSEYGITAPDAQYRRYEESNQSLYDLTDEEFRTIQKLKILQNSSNLSTRDTDDLIVQLFGDNVLFTDRYDMTISYIFPTSQSRLVQIAQSQDLIPRAMAVGASVTFVADPGAIFAYSVYGEDAPGFSVGYAEYGDTDPEGSFLTY